MPYYATNFQFLVQRALAVTASTTLLLHEEVALLHRLLAASEPCIKLTARLLGRKPRWLRLDKLHYPEISDDLGLVAQELVAFDVLQDASSIQELSELLDLLSVAELEALRGTLKAKLPAGEPRNKTTLIAAVLRHAHSQRTIFQGDSVGLVFRRARLTVGAIFRLKPEFAALFDRLETLFFLNQVKHEQSLQTMALVDMNRLKFPAYILATTVQLPFTSRVCKVSSLSMSDWPTRALTYLPVLLATGAFASVSGGLGF